MPLLVSCTAASAESHGHDPPAACLAVGAACYGAVDDQPGRIAAIRQHALDDLLRRQLSGVGFLAHLRSWGYDEPEILPSSNRPICLTGADVGRYPGNPIPWQEELAQPKEDGW